MTVLAGDTSDRVLARAIGWPIPKVMLCIDGCIGLWNVDKCFLRQAPFVAFALPYPACPACPERPRQRRESRPDLLPCSVARITGSAAQVICDCSASCGEAWAWWLGGLVAWG
jgi:hypothetical protein